MCASEHEVTESVKTPRSQLSHRGVCLHSAEPPVALEASVRLSPFAGEYHNFQVLKKKDLGLKFDYLRKIMRNALCWLSLSAQIWTNFRKCQH